MSRISRLFWFCLVLPGLLGLASVPFAPATPVAADGGTTSPYAEEVLADNPIAYWDFDEGSGNVAYDEVSGIDGSRNGPTWITETGVEGSTSALRFDGRNDYVWLGRPPELRLGSYTMETWIRLDDYPSTTHSALLRSRTYGQELNVSRSGQVGSWFYESCTGGGSHTVNSPEDTDVVDGQWHHLVATKDDSALTLYLDGIEVASTSGAPTTCHGSKNFAFGREGDHRSNYYRGDMDEWAWYDYALPADRVLAHYCTGAVDAGPACGPEASADAGPDQAVEEGSVVQLAGQGDGDDLTWTVASASGPPISLVGADTLTPSFTALDDGVYTLRLTASAGSETVSDEVTIAVGNVAPSIGVEAAPTTNDGLIMVSAAVTDPGILDTHAVTVDWGDGSPTSSHDAAAQGAGWASGHAAHVYDAPGTFDITVTLTDDDGGVVTSVTQAVVGGAGVPQPEPGIALWADSTNTKKTLWLAGSDHTVIGVTHSNDEYRVNGSGHSVYGTAEYVDRLQVAGNSTPFENEPVEVSPAAPPVTFDVADYQPGGPAAAEAGDAFHDMSSECGNKWTVTEPLEPGLYWVPCDVDITGSSWAAGPVTIASSGDIKVTGGSKDIVAPFLDGLLFITSSSGNGAVQIAGGASTFAGFVYAIDGSVDVGGSGHVLECGIIAADVKLSGSGHLVDAGRCGLTDPGQSISDGVDVAAPPLLVPSLTVDGDVTPDPIALNATADVTATVTNEGATVVVPGLVALSNSGFGTTTVESVVVELEAADPTGTWSTVASSDDGSATISGLGVESAGVSYGADQLVGTTIAVDAAAAWAVTATTSLDPATVERLLDPAQTIAVRTRVTVATSETFGVRQTTRFGGNTIDALRAATADLQAVEATYSSATGVEGPEPIGELAAGDTSSVSWTITAAGTTEPLTDESETAYLARLGALDGQTVGGVVSAEGLSSVGAIYSPSTPALGAIAAPVVLLTPSVPSAAEPGAVSSWPVTLVNNGSATATALDLSVDDPTAVVSGLPASLAPGETASVVVDVTLPSDATAPVATSLSLTWQDDAANPYGPLSALGRARPILPAALVVEKTSDIPEETPPGEIVYQVIVTNTGTDPVSGVVVDDTPDPGVSIVADSVDASSGTVMSGTAGEGTVVVDVGTLDGGQSAVVEYVVDYTTMPPGQTTITNQAVVSSNELPDVLSDDPSVDGPADPTVFTFDSPPTSGGEDGASAGSATIADVVPADGALVSEPTDVSVGAITPPDGRTIDSWELLAFPAGATPVDGFTVATGTGDPSDSTLDAFDPSTVANGIWVLRVIVTDSTGDVSSQDVSVVVDGQLKLGRFSMTYRDLQVAVGGLPLAVERTYDTLDRSESGDFGHGWDLSIADFTVQTNRTLGLGPWNSQSCGAGLIFVDLCFSPDTPRYVSVTWPNGEVETFDFTPTGNTVFSIQMVPAYTARAGVTSTLASVPGTPAGSLGADGNMHDDGFGGGEIFDPQRFVLTDRFGTTYLLDVDDGLVEATDRNGNTITVTDDGVISSLGPSIDFTRDAEGRISAITGPDGAQVTYAYDAAGDLVSVVGANAATFAYTYGTGEAAHYLLEIDDPGTGPNRVLTYDDEGRLASVTDAEGNTTSIDVDIDARTEIVTSPDGRLTTISSFDERGNALSVNEVYDGANHTSTFTYNASDLPTSRTDALGNTWTGAYDVDENLTTYVDPEGNTSVFTYDQYGFPTSVTDAAGNTTGFAYDAAGNMVSITDARNGVQSFTYDGRGNQTSRTDQTGGVWSWTYDTASRVTAASDPLGNTTTYGYDAAGRMTSLVEADGAAWSYSYDVEGNLTSTVDPLGRSTSSVYDARNRLESTTDPAGNTTRYSYDDNDRLLSTTDPTARQWTYTYVFDRLDAATAPDGGVTAYTYDGAGRTLGVIDPLGRTTTYGYDAAGRRTSITRPAGDGGSATSTWSLDGNGRMVASVNAEGETTSYGLDALGRTVTVTDALGRVSTSTFDAAGNLTASTNPAGETTSYAFDLAGRMTSSTDPADGVTAYGYDAAGNMTSLTDPVDRTWAYGYDQQNRQDTVTLPSGDASSTTFDAAGQVTTQTSAAGVVTTFDYDPRGLLTSVTDALGNTTGYAYDAAGRRTSMTDGRGNTTTYGFDANGRLLSETDPLGGDVTFGYDLAGQRTSVTDPNGATRTAGFDDAGRMVTAVDAEGRTTAYGYDLVGRRTSMTDGRGITINSVFDAAGQLTSRVSPNETQSFVYDPAGRRVEMSDASGTTAYTYDPAGRVTEIASPAGTVAYGWNAAGDQTLMGTADALVATSYDTNGFVAETADWAGDTIAYVNDPDGRITSTTYANGVVSTNSFDAAGRLDRIDHNLAVGSLFFDYTLDANGNRVAVDTVDGTESYTLDALNRLTAATYTDGTSEVFGYDAAGNRTSHTDRDGNTVTYTLDQTGALVTDSNGVVYTTDNAGNLVSSSVGATYVWDDHGRLTEATVDGVTDRAGWNANGDRVELNDATLTLDETGLATVTDNQTDAFLHGEDGISREGDTWVLTDAVGSVRATVDASGELVDTIGYTAFGQPLNPGSTTFGFAGEYTDPTGLVHLRARPYDPGTGRFLAMDPVQPGSPGTTGWQHYAYAGNNPSTWTDPTGQAALIEYNLKNAAIGAAVATATTPWVCDNSDNGAWRPSTDIDGRCFAATVAGGAFFGAFAVGGGAGLARACVYNGAIGAVDGYVTTQLAGNGDPMVAAAFGGTVGCAFSYLAAGLKWAGRTVRGDAPSTSGVRSDSPNGTRPDTPSSGPASGAADGVADDVPVPTGGFCSFTGDTEVLMADGSTKPISEIEIGDLVMAADPDSGAQRGEEVLALFVHDDLTVDFATSAGVVGTTEDHHFFNATDGEWQEAQDFEFGDRFYTPDGDDVWAIGLLWHSAGYERMYNLDVDTLDSYYVLVDDQALLVHNDDVGSDISRQAILATGTQVPPGDFPLRSSAGAVLYVLDAKGQLYKAAEYDAAGYIMRRIDFQGRAHGGVPTPHVVEYDHNVAPDGSVHPRQQKSVRPYAPAC